MAGQDGIAGSVDGDSGSSASNVTLSTPFGLAQQSNGLVWLTESVSPSLFFHNDFFFIIYLEYMQTGNRVRRISVDGVGESLLVFVPLLSNSMYSSDHCHGKWLSWLE